MLKLILPLCFLTSVAFAQNMGEAQNAKKKSIIQTSPKEVTDLFEKNVKEMKASGLEKKALKLGDKAPDVEVTIAGEKMPLSMVYGARPLILKFYRGGWCSYCVSELKYLQDVNGRVENAGAQILAVTPDTVEMVDKTRKTNGLAGFDIVSDEKHSIASKFGLVYDVNSEVSTALKGMGIDIAAYQGDDKADLTIPATYVINKDGRIIFSYVDADYRKRAETEEVMSAIKSLKRRL